MPAAAPAAPPAPRHLAYSLYRLLAVTTGASRDSGTNEYNLTHGLHWNHSTHTCSQHYPTLDMFQGECNNNPPDSRNTNQLLRFPYDPDS